MTPRERQVFELVVRGKVNKQITHQLGTAERTIKAYRQRIMEKMQVQSVLELVSVAVRLVMPIEGWRGRKPIRRRFFLTGTVQNLP